MPIFSYRIEDHDVFVNFLPVIETILTYFTLQVRKRGTRTLPGTVEQGWKGLSVTSSESRSVNFQIFFRVSGGMTLLAHSKHFSYVKSETIKDWILLKFKLSDKLWKKKNTVNVIRWKSLKKLKKKWTTVLVNRNQKMLVQTSKMIDSVQLLTEGQCITIFRYKSCKYAWFL